MGFFTINDRARQFREAETLATYAYNVTVSIVKPLRVMINHHWGAAVVSQASEQKRALDFYNWLLPLFQQGKIPAPRAEYRVTTWSLAENAFVWEIALLLSELISEMEAAKAGHTTDELWDAFTAALLRGIPEICLKSAHR